MKTEVTKISQIYGLLARVSFYISDVAANNCGCNSGEGAKKENPDNLDTLPYDPTTAQVPEESGSTFSPEVSSTTRREEYQKVKAPRKEQPPALPVPGAQDVQDSTEKKEEPLEPPNDVKAGSSELGWSACGFITIVRFFNQCSLIFSLVKSVKSICFIR